MGGRRSPARRGRCVKDEKDNGVKGGNRERLGGTFALCPHCLHVIGEQKEKNPEEGRKVKISFEK